ncbi:MAG: MauE/DoxX family redox-associated membrane protein [Bacteroidota bacterium]
MKRISKHVLAVAFILAGLNHFIDPGFYLPLIPPYFPFPDAINLVSGVLEVVLGVMLWVPKLQRYAAYGLIGLMIAFVPAHVYHIQMDGCPSDVLCLPVWISWVRLLVIQPLLIAWIWWHRE